MFDLINVNRDLKYVKDIFLIDSICFAHDNWSENLIQNEISKGISNYIVCVSCNDVIGYLSYRIVFDEAELDRIAVLPNYRNKGIASLLMQEFIDNCSKNKTLKITLEVRQSNENAILLYKKFGFSEDCIRKDYYFEPKENAILMSLKLND